MDISKCCCVPRPYSPMCLSCHAAHNIVLSSFKCPHWARTKPWELSQHNLKLHLPLVLNAKMMKSERKKSIFIKKCHVIYSSKGRQLLSLCMSPRAPPSRVPAELHHGKLGTTDPPKAASNRGMTNYTLC